MFQHWDELDSGLHSGSVGFYAVHQLQQVSSSYLQSSCFYIIMESQTRKRLCSHFSGLKVLFSGLFLLQLECSGETAQLSNVSIGIILVPLYICHTTILLYVLSLENNIIFSLESSGTFVWIKQFMKSFL